MAFAMPSFRSPHLDAGFRVSWGANMLYLALLDEFGHVGPCVPRGDPRHNDSPQILSAIAEELYNSAGETHSQLIEPPLFLKSHRYQTIQAADWIAGLVGRLGAYWTELEAWPENELFRRYFRDRLAAAQVRSDIRS